MSELPLEQLNLAGARLSRAAPGKERLIIRMLVLFFSRLLARPLAGQRSLHSLFLAGLQVEGVALYLLDNVFLLHLSLEAAQSILEGFALLKSYVCQPYTPPDSSRWTEYLCQGFDPKSSESSRLQAREFPVCADLLFILRRLRAIMCRLCAFRCAFVRKR
jgi:hypothetical protein